MPFLIMWRYNFEIKLIRACIRLLFLKSNLPYFNPSDRDLTVFEADPFIYFIRTELVFRLFVYTWYFNNIHSLVILVYVKRV